MAPLCVGSGAPPEAAGSVGKRGVPAPGGTRKTELENSRSLQHVNHNAVGRRRGGRGSCSGSCCPSGGFLPASPHPPGLRLLGPLPTMSQGANLQGQALGDRRPHLAARCPFTHCQQRRRGGRGAEARPPELPRDAGCFSAPFPPGTQRSLPRPAPAQNSSCGTELPDGVLPSPSPGLALLEWSQGPKITS